VQQFAGNCLKRLSLGDKILFEGIGEFSSNAEGSIRFRHLNHANFYTGVFGMEPLNLYPLVRQKSQERFIQKPQDRKPRPTREKQPASVRWTLILSLPVILFLLYGIIFPSSVQNLYRNYSGLLFDIGGPEGVQQPVLNNIIVPPEVIVLNTPEPSPAEKTFVPAEKTVVPARKVVVPSVKTVDAVEASVQQSLKYYIIGGCFISEDNAAKFLKELIGRGFEAEKAGSNNRGQIRISYKSFTDRTAALSYLQMIRDQENPSAWLLKY
jgi:hypothetical protein